MKIVTSAATIGTAAALADHAIIKREAKRFTPLSAAQFRATTDSAALILNNRNFQIGIAFAADVEVPGNIATSAEKLAKLIEALPKDAEIVIESGDNVASITSGRRKFKLPIIPADGLPVDLHVDTETGAVTLPTRADALNLFARTCFAAASPKDSRHYLRGVFLHNVGDELIAVATDSYILARFAVASPGMLSKDRHFIVPTDAAEFIKKLLADKSLDNVMLRASKTLFAVESTSVSFITRLVDGSFPAYEKAIPEMPPGGVTVARSELLAALARAIATSGGRELDLAWSDSELRLSVADVSDDVIDAEVAQTGTIAVDARRLHDLVTELPAGMRLTLAAANPREPLRLTVEGISGFLAVLAPRHTSEAQP